MTQQAPQAPQPPQSPPFPYPDRNRHEKDEKNNAHDEKDEKSRNEKSQDEKFRRDPLSALTWAAILIWAGVVLLAQNLGYLSFLTPWKLDAGSVIFLGAGLLILLAALIRLVLPDQRRGVVGSFILGLVFLAIGASNTAIGTLIWPIALIVLGVAIVIGGLLRR
jgi:hypothetical protein